MHYHQRSTSHRFVPQSMLAPHLLSQPQAICSTFFRSAELNRPRTYACCVSLSHVQCIAKFFLYFANSCQCPHLSSSNATGRIAATLPICPAHFSTIPAGIVFFVSFTLVSTAAIPLSPLTSLPPPRDWRRALIGNPRRLLSRAAVSPGFSAASCEGGFDQAASFNKPSHNFLAITIRSTSTGSLKSSLTRKVRYSRPLAEIIAQGSFFDQ